MEHLTKSLAPVKWICCLLISLSLSSCASQDLNLPTKTVASTDIISAGYSEQITITPTRESTLPAPGKTPTKISTPTKSPQPNVPSFATFSLDSASSELPKNLMDQISYYPGFGGGGFEYDPCENAPRGTLTFLGKPQTESFLYGVYYLETCGWKANEKIRVTILLANGDSYKVDENADKYGFLSYALDATPDDIPGGYTIAFNGQSGRLKTKFTKYRPEETGAFLVENVIILYNFEPFEKVRLTLYKNTSKDMRLVQEKFIGWQDYQVDQDGNLRITIDMEIVGQLVYNVIGEISGRFPEVSSDFGCSKEIPKLALQSKAKVTNPDNTPLIKELESYRPFDTKVYTWAELNEVGTVIEGPRCHEYQIYWKVLLEGGQSGWIIERDLKPQD